MHVSFVPALNLEAPVPSFWVAPLVFSFSLLAPPPGDSLALRAALAEFEALAERGGWPEVPPGPTFRLGDQGPRVAALRARLMASGDLLPPGSAVAIPLPVLAADTLFDEDLEVAVRRAQSRHGLAVDGLVGPETLRALNVPIETRIRQIIHNLHARRAFADRWQEVLAAGRMHILINIPAFEAWVLEAGRPPERHRAVVGRVDRRTPELAAEIGHLVLAPFWVVPPGILRRDLLPQIRRDPTTLARRRIRVLDRATGREVDTAGFVWTDLTAAALDARYMFRQDPGPWNALGQVKFIFPNPHWVYLHDTPDQHLFDEPRRAFSSGCIRIEGAMGLAERIAQTQLPEWDRTRLQRVAAGGTERWIRLPEPIPIQTVYWTAWVSPQGVLHLADDLYGWDGSDPALGSVEACS